MTFRPILTAAFVSIALAACGGGGSDSADTTLPVITLITTTSEAPDFSEGDGDIAGAATTESPEDSITTEAEAADSTTTTTTTTTEAAAATVAPETSTDTTEPAAPETTPVESAPAPIDNGFVLQADGLGVIPFGADPEQTITFVSSVVGAPTADTGWLDSFEIGGCIGTRIRQVSWNQLQLEFGDVSNVREGTDHFYAYYYGAEQSSTAEPAGLRTAQNVGVGSTVAELIAAYPAATFFEGDEFIAPSFTVNDNLAGRVSGLADDDIVEVVIGGLPCEG